MSRSEHQPIEGMVTRPDRKQDEFLGACGRTVGVILALEESTEPLVVQFEDPERKPVVCAPAHDGLSVSRPLQAYEGVPAVCHVVDACRRAQLNEVFVVAAESIADEVSGLCRRWSARSAAVRLQL